jgi:hypothetical protein
MGATRQERAEPHGSSPGEMTSLHVAAPTGSPRGTPIEAASTPGLSWRGGIELYAGGQDEAYLDRLKRSKVSGRPRAGGSVRFSTAALRAALRLLLC